MRHNRMGVAHRYGGRPQRGVYIQSKLQSNLKFQHLDTRQDQPLVIVL